MRDGTPLWKGQMCSRRNANTNRMQQKKRENVTLYRVVGRMRCSGEAEKATLYRVVGRMRCSGEAEKATLYRVVGRMRCSGEGDVV